MEFVHHSPDMSYTEVPHRVFDCDQHLYETAEAFQRYVPEAHANAIKIVEVDGRKKVVVKGKISAYIPNPTFEVVAAPGSGMEYFAAKNPEGRSFREIVTPMKSIPEFNDPGARLRLLDRMHVDAVVNFPTLASVVEVNFMNDPVTSQVLVHAYNQWLFDDWGFDHRGRIFTTPVMNLSMVEGAVAELEWALERDARAILVRPAPVAGWLATKSPFLPEFDPFWARVQEAGVPVMLHISDCGYQRYANEWLGRTDDELLPFEPDVFSIMVTHDRPITDTIWSAIGHGMLSRFPGVKLATIECGSSWLGLLQERLLDAYGRLPQQFLEHPLDVLQRQVYVAPFWEDDLQPVIDAVGIDHVIFNSDWPHPEGLADPNSYIECCHESGFDDATIAKVMGGNMFDLIGV
jgi:predicted TIM-barrel fold metal-dependent hydrolase